MPQTSAFDKPKTRELFAPPPRRDPASAGTSPAQNNQVTLEEDEEEEQEEEAKGEWCVALYDFSSSVCHPSLFFSAYGLLMCVFYRNLQISRSRRMIRFGSHRGRQRIGGWLRLMEERDLFLLLMSSRCNSYWWGEPMIEGSVCL